LDGACGWQEKTSCLKGSGEKFFCAFAGVLRQYILNFWKYDQICAGFSRDFFGETAEVTIFAPRFCVLCENNSRK
jgi:hypothetical protein